MDVTAGDATTNPLVGTWKVVSFQFEFEEASRRSDVYEKPCGFIIVTADGRFTAILADGARSPSDAPNMLFDRMMAYSGRYRLQGDDCFVTTVDIAWHPSWIGTEQTRYFKLDGDTLSIISPPQPHPKAPGQLVRGVIVWQRERNVPSLPDNGAP
jgi:hypothetical protein